MLEPRPSERNPAPPGNILFSQREGMGADFGHEIGYCPDPYGNLHRIWFSRWFLDKCFFRAPACIYQRDGRKVTRTVTSKISFGQKYDIGHTLVWILTDEYDELGRRLGVWPD